MVEICKRYNLYSFKISLKNNGIEAWVLFSGNSGKGFQIESKDGERIFHGFIYVSNHIKYSESNKILFSNKTHTVIWSITFSNWFSKDSKTFLKKLDFLVKKKKKNCTFLICEKLIFNLNLKNDIKIELASSVKQIASLIL